MASTREILAERVSELVEADSRSARAISMAATGTPDTIRDLLRRKSLPNAEILEALAEALDTTSDYLLGKTDSPHPVRSEVAFREAPLPFRGQRPDASLPLVGTGDCAELIVNTEDGEPVEIERSSFDPDYLVRMVARPPALAGVKEAYAIEFRGDSMLPRYEAGDYGIVDPRRAYGAGDYVVVQLRAELPNGDGEDQGWADTVGSVLVKRLVRKTTRELVLEQFNPPLVFTLPMARVLHIHRILRDLEYWS